MSSYCQNIGMNLTLLEILEDLINLFSRAERPPARHGTARSTARSTRHGTRAWLARENPNLHSKF